MALWRDSFIVFGGGENPSGVQIYNITAGTNLKNNKLHSWKQITT